MFEIRSLALSLTLISSPKLCFLLHSMSDEGKRSVSSCERLKWLTQWKCCRVLTLWRWYWECGSMKARLNGTGVLEKKMDRGRKSKKKTAIYVFLYICFLCVLIYAWARTVCICAHESACFYVLICLYAQASAQTINDKCDLYLQSNFLGIYPTR